MKIAVLFLTFISITSPYISCATKKRPSFSMDINSIRNTKTAKNSKSVETQNVISRVDSEMTLNTNGSEKKIKIYLQPPLITPNPWYKDILPIITLILGLVLKELIDILSSAKRTKKIGKRWKTELELLTKPLERQVKEINETIENLKSRPNDTPKLVGMASLDCENFESLDKSELLNYINRYYLKDYKEAVSMAGQINLQINVIKGNIESLKETYVTGLQNFGKRHDIFNSNFQELLQSLHIYKNAVLNSDGQEALSGDKFNTLNRLYGEQVLPHIEDGKFDYRKLNSEYFEPMIKELDRLSADQAVHDMASYTRKCLDNVAGLKMESLYLTTNLNQYISYFNKSKEELEKILASLDQKNKIFRIL